MANTPIVLGHELVKEYVSKNLPDRTRYRQAFKLHHKIEYEKEDYSKGIYSPTLTMLMMDDETELDDITLSVTWYGEFYFQSGKSHIKENDLFGCLKYLSDKIQEHLYKKHGLSLAVLVEETELYETLCAFVKSTQS